MPLRRLQTRRRTYRGLCPAQLLALCLIGVLLSLWVVPRPTAAQTPTPEPTPTPVDPEQSQLTRQVETIMRNMSVADRVGQLFLVGFEGARTGFDSDIAELIYGYRVGGVILSPANGNFSNDPAVDTPVQVATVTNRLQALSYGLLLPGEHALNTGETGEWPPLGSVSMEQVTNVPPINLPLFVAVEQSGDGLPATALRNGFTPLPSELALGATWNPQLTSQVGGIVGRELSAVGVNMLLGPTLDVLEQPQSDMVGALGLHVFGGDPAWVGQMGRAYVGGVHTGSSGQVATIARHFPGAGDADRLPDQEVATIQRSLEELERVTLPSFQAVARGPSSILRTTGDPAATDGMMSSHIRYTGFQGTSQGRNTPISLSPELETVLAREGFAEWRTQGGLMVSNVLGAPAIRRHYDPSLTEFPYRRVAMDAFTAGHDLLYLDRFSLDDQWENEKQNIQETIAFFQERYVRDPDFAAEVDDSVRRILTLKLRLYGDAIQDEAPSLPQEQEVDARATAAPAEVLTATGSVTTTNDLVTPTLPLPTIALTNVLVSNEDLQVLEGETRGSAAVTVGQVARESFTILYPDPGDASEMVAVAPQADTNLLIVSDSRSLRECAGCKSQPAVGPDQFASILEQFYGPNGTGQLTGDQVNSLTFDDMARLMTADAQATEAEQEDAQQQATGTPPADAGSEVTGTQTAPEPSSQATAPAQEITATVTSVTATAVPTTAVPATPTAPVTTEAGAPVTSSMPVTSTAVTTTVDAVENGTGGESGEAIDGEGGHISPTLGTMRSMMRQADWIIFAMLDVSPSDYPQSDVVKRFLRQQGAQYGDKRVVVLALQAPSFLDATEISKLDGYYGVYGKTGPFLESAARALFRAYTPSGAPPISVAGTRFASLSERLQPDPNQAIDLRVLSPDGDVIAGESSADGSSTPRVPAGTLVRIQAGPIEDYNGAQVRNGTPVEIGLTYDGGGEDVETVMAQNGMAVREVVVDRGGVARVHAQAASARSTEAVALSVQESASPTTVATQTPGSGGAVAVVAPTSPAATEPVVSEPNSPAPGSGDGRRINLISLAVSLVVMMAMIGLLLVVQVRVLPRPTLVNNLLWAINCGLLAYILYGLGLIPGGVWLEGSLRVWGAGLVVLIAMLLPLVWLQLRTIE